MKSTIKATILLGLALFAILFTSCSKEEVYPTDRVCLNVGESRVIELDGNVAIFEDSVRLLYEDTEVCKVSDISNSRVTVYGLHRGVDILHIEYATKKSALGYSSIELRIEVQ